MTVAVVLLGSMVESPFAVRAIVAAAYLAGLWLEGTVAAAAHDLRRRLQDSSGGR